MSLIAALALVLGGVVLATGKAEAAPSVASVAATDGGAAASIGSLQVDPGGLIRAIVCPILTRLATGPFGSFIGPTIAALRLRFGCVSP